MFCKQCGAQLEDTADFCRFCGADMREIKMRMQAAAAAPAPAPEPPKPMAPEMPEPMNSGMPEPMSGGQANGMIQDIPDNPYAEELEPVTPGEDGTTVLMGDAYIPGHGDDEADGAFIPSPEYLGEELGDSSEAGTTVLTGAEFVPGYDASKDSAFPDAKAPVPEPPKADGFADVNEKKPNMTPPPVVPIMAPGPNMGPGPMGQPPVGQPPMGQPPKGGPGAPPQGRPPQGRPAQGPGSGPLPGVNGTYMDESGTLVQTGALAQPGFKNGTGDIHEVSYQGGNGDIAVPPYNDVANFGKAELRTNRSLLKYIFLGIVTLGIYDLWVLYTLAEDLNILAYKHDGKRTMNVMLVDALASCTLGISVLVWNHKMAKRIGDELQFRNIDYKINSGTYWLWGVLGSFIIVGPFIYTHKLLKAMNLLCTSYNLYDK